MLLNFKISYHLSQYILNWDKIKTTRKLKISSIMWVYLILNYLQPTFLPAAVHECSWKQYLLSHWQVYLAMFSIILGFLVCLSQPNVLSSLSHPLLHSLWYFCHSWHITSHTINQVERVAEALDKGQLVWEHTYTYLVMCIKMHFTENKV